jgi:hypothetical protein
MERQNNKTQLSKCLTSMMKWFKLSRRGRKKKQEDDAATSAFEFHNTQTVLDPEGTSRYQVFWDAPARRKDPRSGKRLCRWTTLVPFDHTPFCTWTLIVSLGVGQESGGQR